MPHRLVPPRLPVAALALLLAAAATGQDEAARARLDASPRHHEWVEIERGPRLVHAFVAYPEVAARVPVVIVLHENRGLTDWVRGVADRLAEVGYVAVAPDLLSGMGPGGGRTRDFADSDAAREAIYGLAQEQVTADLLAVSGWAATLPAGDGTVAVAGFCWGGQQAFHLAGQGAALAAAFVFYGTPPEEDELLGRIEGPVYGFYGGEDARVTATVAPTADRMRAAGKVYEPIVYDGAGHGFLRAAEGAEASDAERRAAAAAWERWLELLGRL